MKQVIFLIDVGNAKFLIDNVNNKYKLPSLEYQKDIKNINDDFFKKYKNRV